MKRSLKSLAASTAIVGMSFLFSLAADAAGSIAVNNCGTYGYSYGKSSIGEAEEVALQECGAGCSTVLHFENACGAFATDQNRRCGAQGWGWAGDRGGAERIALDECLKHGGENCVIQHWVCDGG